MEFMMVMLMLGALLWWLLKPAKTFGGKGIGGTVYTLRGVRELLEVYEDKVSMTPKGGCLFLGMVHKGMRTIPFFSITAVEFKKGGLLFGSSLHFTVPGGKETPNPFTVGADSGSFECASGGRQDALALEIKDYIEKKIMELHRPTASSSGPGLSGELQKLADMRAKKILSEEEFQAAKRRLLG